MDTFQQHRVLQAITDGPRIVFDALRQLVGRQIDFVHHSLRIQMNQI